MIETTTEAAVSVVCLSFSENCRIPYDSIAIAPKQDEPLTIGTAIPYTCLFGSESSGDKTKSLARMEASTYERGDPSALHAIDGWAIGACCVVPLTISIRST